MNPISSSMSRIVAPRRTSVASNNRRSKRCSQMVGLYEHENELHCRRLEKIGIVPYSWLAGFTLILFVSSSTSSWVCASSLPFRGNHAVIQASTTTTKSLSFSTASTATSAAGRTATSTVQTSTPKNKNIIAQCIGFVKEAVESTIKGCGQLYENHKECNVIRQKIKQHQSILVAQWTGSLDTQQQQSGQNAESNQGGGGGAVRYDSIKEAQKEAQKVTAGISYKEYQFLQQGKEDRGRLMNLVFLMWGAPKFLPYALLFNPDMMPSAFAVTPMSAKYDKYLESSRQASTAILQTLLKLEEQVQQQGAPAMGLGKLNVFGFGKKEKDEKDAKLRTLYAHTVDTLLLGNGKSRTDNLIQSVEPLLYKKTIIPPVTASSDTKRKSKNPEMLWTRAEQRLCQIPPVLMKGLSQALGGSSGIFASLQPQFMVRGKWLGHLKKVTDADDFLVQARIDLDTVQGDALQRACRDRMIGGPGSSEQELRGSLREWLDLMVRDPIAKIRGFEQQHQDSSSLKCDYNANLARTILMGYHGCMAIQHSRTTGMDLPRLVFTGQEGAKGVIAEDLSQRQPVESSRKSRKKKS